MTREIRIIPVLNGFIVYVGCQTVVFQGRDTLPQALADYIKDPEASESYYLKSAINRTGDQVEEARDDRVGRHTQEERIQGPSGTTSGQVSEQRVEHGGDSSRV
uniref:Uncharacterized protein n=1 Tax=viral metagenome TaxID=1070528 RepID=A0A6M3IP26_9ZZZZ